MHTDVGTDTPTDRDASHLKIFLTETSLPYFRVKLSCVCLMFAYRKKVMTYSDPMVTYSHPKMTYSYPKVT